MVGADQAITAALRRDRLIVLLALAAITILAWVYIYGTASGMTAAPQGAPSMPDMDAMAPAFSSWTLSYALIILAMWAIMMVGMMTPSVSPMLLIYAHLARQAHTSGDGLSSVWWFAGGYLLAWTVFAAVATAVQYGLERLAILSAEVMRASPLVGGLLLIFAGLYQWMPSKHACLSRCRAPLAFVQTHGGFQSTRLGSLRLGLLHGGYCIGCCWALMVLLFVGGVMNILWIAGLMFLILAEKVAPGGQYLARVAGSGAIIAGAWMLSTS